MRTNFTAKTAKALKATANKDQKGMNQAIKSVQNAWNAKDKGDELSEAIKAAKADGLKISDFSAAFILEHLNGTKWVNGSAIMTSKKGERFAKTTWTAGQVVDYVRRANKARLEKAAKAAKAE